MFTIFISGCANIPWKYRIFLLLLWRISWSSFGLCSMLATKYMLYVNRAPLAVCLGPSEFDEVRLPCVLWGWKGGLILCCCGQKSHFLIGFWAKSGSAFGLTWECYDTSSLTWLTILPGPRKPEYDYLFHIHYHGIICNREKKKSWWHGYTIV